MGDFKDNIKSFLSNVDLVQLIAERVKLERSGKSFKGLCPFHREKTGSFYVTPELGTFKCYGCGVHRSFFFRGSKLYFW